MTSSAPDELLQALTDDDPVDLYEAAPVAYLSMSPDGVLVKANRTFFQWTGLEPDVVGRIRFADLLAPGDRIFYETHFATSLRLQGQVREIAVDVVGAGGGRLPVLVNGRMKLDDAGRPAVARLVLFDARERRSYEQELVRARRRAEASEARASSLARTLQASLLPPELIDVPGFDVGAAFRPSGDGTVIGGDFYDLFRTRSGQAEVVLGDVCGKGPEAAVVSSLARYTARALAADDVAPSEVLHGVHRTLLQYHPSQFCTAVMVRIIFESASDGDTRSIVVSVAGHPRPLCRRAAGTFESLGEHGPMLGMIGVAQQQDRHDHLVDLAPGDVVVLYTDGVTEARSPDGTFYTEERLKGVVDAHAGAGAQELADVIVDSVLSYQEGSARDDVAVVVLAPE